MKKGFKKQVWLLIWCVQVMDKNDNGPEFAFPSPQNSTVRLSSYAPPGHVVTHLTAHDLDAGDKVKVAQRSSQGHSVTVTW